MGPESYTEFGEITQNKGHYARSRSFKVIDICTNRKLTCDFLLVINNNLPHILRHFQVNNGRLLVNSIFRFNPIAEGDPL